MCAEWGRNNIIIGWDARKGDNLSSKRLYLFKKAHTGDEITDRTYDTSTHVITCLFISFCTTKTVGSQIVMSLFVYCSALFWIVVT